MKGVDCTSVITYDVTLTSYQARHEESLTTPGAIKLTLIGARSTANARVTPSRAPALPAVKVQFLRGLASTEPRVQRWVGYSFIYRASGMNGGKGYAPAVNVIDPPGLILAAWAA